MRAVFAGNDQVRPSARWRSAFPQAETVVSRPLQLTQAADTLLWVDSALDNWQEVVRSAQHSGVGGIAVLAATPTEEQGLEALGLGARAYCHAWAPAAMLQEVALVVSRGGLWVGAELLQRFMAVVQQRLAPAAEPAGLELLTGREREVALSVADGHSNKFVAAELGISERTVKAHLGNIFSKLGVSSRLQLALHLRVED